MSLARTVKNDIALVKERFPKLKLLNNDGKPPSFAGVLDICDESGNWYGSYEIRLLASSKYPFGVPAMLETGGLIAPVADRHINADGSCCVDMPHVLLYRATREFTICDYLQEFAFPYFANQLYFEANGHYAAGEYAHGFAGVVQFYKETLKVDTPITARLLLLAVLNNTLPARNMVCFCGSGKKYKNCHRNAVEYLASLGRFRLSGDLESFEMLVAGEQILTAAG